MSAPSLLLPAGTARFVRLLFPTIAILFYPVLWSAVTRSVSDDPYSPIITILVSPPPETAAYAVEESISGGAQPTEISHDGWFDEATAKTKWGPFTDGEPRSLTYRLTGPAGSITLAGTASFDGSSEATGNGSTVLPDPSTTFFGQQFLTRDPRDFTLFPIDPATDRDQDGITEFARYAFALESGAIELDETLQMSVLHFDGPSVQIRILINGNAADVAYVLESTDDLVEWQPIESRFAEIQVSRKPVADLPGVDEIVYGPISLNANGPLAVRMRGDWLSFLEP